jgi:hypothetical protein
VTFVLRASQRNLGIALHTKEPASTKALRYKWIWGGGKPERRSQGWRLGWGGEVRSVGRVCGQFRLQQVGLLSRLGLCVKMGRRVLLPPKFLKLALGPLTSELGSFGNVYTEGFGFFFGSTVI